jgi:predicted DNA-binding protein
MTKSIQLYVSEEQHKQLRQFYADTGRTMNDVIREAISTYFEKRAKEEKKKEDKK